MAYTARNAAESGFAVWVVLDACRGIAEETIAQEKERMLAAGVRLVATVDDLPKDVVFAADAEGLCAPSDPAATAAVAQADVPKGSDWGCVVA